MIRQAEKQLLEKLIESPHLPLYAREIQAVLNREAQNRQAFYEQINEDDKAEFINGQVIIHSPVRLRHNSASGNLYHLLKAHVARYNLGFVGHEKIMVSLTRNDYEPDICFFAREKAAGFTPDQLHFPAPDMVVEIISASTEAIDRETKFDDYALHGVSEYWIVDPVEETVEQYQLQEEGYTLLLKVKDGRIDSTAVPNFSIPVRAIFDEAENQAVLQAILG